MCATTMPTAMRPPAISVCVTMGLLGTELTVKVYVRTYIHERREGGKVIRSYEASNTTNVDVQAYVAIADEGSRAVTF